MKPDVFAKFMSPLSISVPVKKEDGLVKRSPAEVCVALEDKGSGPHLMTSTSPSRVLVTTPWSKTVLTVHVIQRLENCTRSPLSG